MYTRHGHQIKGTRIEGIRPVVEKCGGPSVCAACSIDYVFHKTTSEVILPIYSKKGSSVKDDKYVTFKRVEFEQWFEDYLLKDESFRDSIPLPLEDATVIRGQDLFAAPSLDVYAASIAIVLKFGGMTDDTRRELQAAADYFHMRANESRAISFKTPDKGLEK